MLIFWIIFALIIALVLMLGWIIDGKSIAKKTFVCGNCGKEFSPKWWKAGFSVHMGENTVLKCPHCETKSFCPPTYRK